MGVPCSVANWIVQARNTGSGSASAALDVITIAQAADGILRQQDAKLNRRLAHGRRRQRLELRNRFGLGPRSWRIRARMAGVPFIGKRLHLNQGMATRLNQILRASLRLTIAHLENASVGAVVDIRVVVVALVLVVPINQKHVAVGAVFDTDDLRPDVVGKQKIRGMRTDEARSAASQDVAVDSSRRECCS